MSEKELLDLIRRAKSLTERSLTDGPQNDDELHALIKSELGVDIPRVAVCEGHVAPFKFIADLYFERTSAALALASRGGSKTHNVAILHYLNSTFKPGCGSLTFAATEGQGRRCYKNIEDWCYVTDPTTGRRTETVKPFIRDKPLKSNTTWKTGSTTEIVAGSENAVSGPHSAKAHADEVDLMEPGVWTQSRGIAVANRATGPLPKWMKSFNGMIPPQDIVTSTRNSTRGLMQELLDEIEEDIKNGNLPQFDLFKWCIWECITQISNCRGANEHERRAACIQVGLPADSLCDCNRVVKGKMDDGSDRTLEKVCDGKAFISRGWKPEIDLIRTFKRNTPGTWKLQHECGVGQDENNYIEDWSLPQYGVTKYDPNPLYGPIYQGVDWGDTNPHCVLWFQYLTCEVPTTGFEEEPVWLMPGSYVLFKEIYKAGMATDRLANLVIDTENQYRLKYPNWKVKGRFCDPQGAGDRRIFHNHGLRSSWPIKTRNKQTMVDVVQNLVIDGRFFVDFRQAPVFCEEVEVWGKNPKTGKEVDKFNHAMSAWRYGISNAEILESKNRFEKEKAKPTRGTKAASPIPVYSQAGERDMFKAGPVATRGGSQVIIDPQFNLKH